MRGPSGTVAVPGRFPMPFQVVGRVPSRGVMIAIPPWACGQSGSGILPLIHGGQAARSRFHFLSAFMEGGSGILPLDAIQPELGRLCHAAAAGRGKGMKGASRRCGTRSQGMGHRPRSSKARRTRRAGTLPTSPSRRVRASHPLRPQSAAGSGQRPRRSSPRPWRMRTPLVSPSNPGS